MTLSNASWSACKSKGRGAVERGPRRRRAGVRCGVGGGGGKCELRELVAGSAFARRSARVTQPVQRAGAAATHLGAVPRREMPSAVRRDVRRGRSTRLRRAARSVGASQLLNRGRAQRIAARVDAQRREGSVDAAPRRLFPPLARARAGASEAKVVHVAERDRRAQKHAHEAQRGAPLKRVNKRIDEQTKEI